MKYSSEDSFPKKVLRSSWNKRGVKICIQIKNCTFIFYYLDKDLFLRSQQLSTFQGNARLRIEEQEQKEGHFLHKRRINKP